MLVPAQSPELMAKFEEVYAETANQAPTFWAKIAIPSCRDRHPLEGRDTSTLADPKVVDELVKGQ